MKKTNVGLVFRATALGALLLLAAPAGYGQAVAAAGVKARAAARSPRPAAAEDKSIRPFRIDIPEAALVDLRRRVLATRWPDKETVF
jgi:hypothetical protein